MMVEAWLVLVELIIVSTVSHAWGMHRGERRALRASSRQPDELRIGSSPYRELPPGFFSQYSQPRGVAPGEVLHELGQEGALLDEPPPTLPPPAESRRERPGWTLSLHPQDLAPCPHDLDGKSYHLAVSAKCESKCLVTSGRWAPHVHARCHRCQATWMEAVAEPTYEADRGGAG